MIDPTAAPNDPEREAREEALREAIGVQLRTVGSRNWAEVRERPEFAPYYGKDAGVAGDRQFWRIRAQVVRKLSADKTRPSDGRHTNDSHRDWARLQVDERRTAGEPITPAQIFWMANGKGGQTKIDAAKLARQLIEDAEQQRADARRLGDLRERALALKASRDTLQFLLEVQPRLDLMEKQMEFMTGLIAVLRLLHADDPERLKAAVAAFQVYLEEWGLPPAEEAA